MVLVLETWRQKKINFVTDTCFLRLSTPLPAFRNSCRKSTVKSLLYYVQQIPLIRKAQVTLMSNTKVQALSKGVVAFFTSIYVFFICFPRSSMEPGICPNETPLGTPLFATRAVHCRACLRLIRVIQQPILRHLIKQIQLDPYNTPTTDFASRSTTNTTWSM